MCCLELREELMKPSSDYTSTGKYASVAARTATSRALPEEFIQVRSKSMWRLSFVGMTITTFNVIVSLTVGFNERVSNDMWVGAGIMLGLVASAWFARKKRLMASLISLSLGLNVSIILGDLCYGEYTERLLYLLLAVAVSGFGLDRRALVVTSVMTFLGLVGLSLMMPGEFRLGPKTFPSLLIDITAILIAASILFYVNASVTRDALSQARDKHEESEHQRQIAEQAASHAEVANNSKSMFLANVSHELRTPLNAILGYVELIQEESEDDDQAWYVDELGRVHSAAGQLLGLINDVLDLSKMEAGRLQIIAVEFELGELLSELEDIITPLASAQGNTLIFHGMERACAMHTDRMRLKQVVLNLLSNSVKFTQNGEVSVHIHHFEREARAPWLGIEVRDTGIGMTVPQLQRIFEPFLQGSAGTSHQYGGTGLGLALSRRICAMLGGEIHVESVWGKGSTFTVEIPCQWSADQPEDDGV